LGGVAFLSRGTRICPVSAIFKFLNVCYFLVTGLFLGQAWRIKVNRCLSITFAVDSLSVKFVVILLSKDLWLLYYNIQGVPGGMCLISGGWASVV
jgi:hypothetical protein